MSFHLSAASCFSFDDYPAMISPISYEGRLLEFKDSPLDNTPCFSLLDDQEEECTEVASINKHVSNACLDSPAPKNKGYYNTRNRDSRLKLEDKSRRQARAATKKLKDVLRFFNIQSRNSDLRTRVLRLHRRFLREQPIEGIAKTSLKYLQEYLDNPPLCDQPKPSSQSSKAFQTYNANYCKYFFGKSHRRPVLNSYHSFVSDLFDEQDPYQVLGLYCQCTSTHSKLCMTKCKELKKHLISDTFLF